MFNLALSMTRPRRHLTDNHSILPSERSHLLRLLREGSEFEVAANKAGVAFDAIEQDHALLAECRQAYRTGTAFISDRLLQQIVVDGADNPRLLAERLKAREALQAQWPQPNSNGGAPPLSALLATLPDDVLTVLQAALDGNPDPFDELVEQKVQARLMLIGAEQAADQRAEPEPEPQFVNATVHTQPRRAKSSRRLKREARKQADNVVSLPVVEPEPEQVVFWHAYNLGIGQSVAVQELTPPTRLVKADPARMFSSRGGRESSCAFESGAKSRPAFVDDPHPSNGKQIWPPLSKHDSDGHLYDRQGQKLWTINESPATSYRIQVCTALLPLNQSISAVSSTNSTQSVPEVN
jgi:hypothetical protein